MKPLLLILNNIEYDLNVIKTIFLFSASSHEDDVRLLNLLIQRFDRDIPLVDRSGKKMEKISNSVPTFKRVSRAQRTWKLKGFT